MIPKLMENFLRQQLPERTWQNRLFREDGMCFMEFGPMDIDRLTRLGIAVDSLGPKLVACLWDDSTPLEVGGFLVVDNLAMGRPSMGGIRMLPNLTPSEIHNLARGMTLKNAAANLPYGGGKSGIVADPGHTPEEHSEIVRRFARLLYRYRDIYLPGPDVGTNDADMKTVAIENGLDNTLSKPVEMGGNRIDQLGAAGGGLIIALEALLEELPRLQVLSQFIPSEIPKPNDITVIIQGFGAVGSHAARILNEKLPLARVVGISDISGYLYDYSGLPVDILLQLRQEFGVAAQPYYQRFLTKNHKQTKFSTAPDDLLRESAFCMIPAAPVANYLDTDPTTQPSITTDRIGNWAIIIEGANTYSPDPARQSARARMEREIYRRRGIIIATDYLVNSGGVIFAAQEHLIKTPLNLRIPEEMLGNVDEVKQWLDHHAEDLQKLAENRLQAAEKAREEVIRRNMHELIDLLVSDADMLPSEAAEKISIRRITSIEKHRNAANIMERMITIPFSNSVRDAAKLLVETGTPILAVVDSNERLIGIITDWDITLAAAEGSIESMTLESIMTRKVISALPNESILDLVRKLEYHEISAMPIVEGDSVLGMVSTDILARRSLYRLLQSQTT
jgi:glutamate dehydrogenase (NAD(P)+)